MRIFDDDNDPANQTADDGDNNLTKRINNDGPANQTLRCDKEEDGDDQTVRPNTKMMSSVLGLQQIGL